MERQFESRNTFLPSTGQILAEIVRGTRNLIRSEMRLAKAEASDTARTMARDSARAAVFGIVALLGVLPLIAFFVIGLGALLGERYWLSALIIGLVLVAIGAWGVMTSIQAISRREVTLPAFRSSVRHAANTNRGAA